MNIKINLAEYTDFFSKQITSTLGHAYPDKKLKEEHIHTAIEGAKATLICYAALLKEIRENTDEKRIINLLLDFNQLALSRVEKCYKDGTLGDWVSSHANITAMYDVRDAIVMTTNILDGKFFEISFPKLCNNLLDHNYIYQYVVKNNKVQQGNLHAGCQISMRRLISTIGILQNVYANNKDNENASMIKKIIESSQSTLNGFSEAYPDGYYDSSLGWTVFKLSHSRVNEIKKFINDNKDKFEKNVEPEKDIKAKSAINYSI